MNKLFLHILLLLSSSLYCLGQSDEIDLSNLYSEEGKAWKRFVRPDGDQIHPDQLDDLFIFYSNGQFKYDQGATVTRNLSHVKSKNWIFNKETSIMTLELVMANGAVKKFSAEITYLDDQRAVFNLSEDGKEPKIVVLIPN